MTPLILDGTALAARRMPMLTERAAHARHHLGRPAALLIIAFADEHGRVPHVRGKVAAFDRAGMRAHVLHIAADTSTTDAIARMQEALDADPFDGVFLQFPFPEGIAADTFCEALPVGLDVDVMSPARVDAWLSDEQGPPPVTISAGLLLLEEYDVDIAGMHGVVVGATDSFTTMFRVALARRGAHMAPVTAPDEPHLHDLLRGSELVVVAAASPAALSAESLAPGTVAIDVGYFNEGGRGDIDVTAGISHLRALSPVPGGIGPMTVSALMERVLHFAGA